MDVGALVNQQYNVIEHIGRGGMADVWSARDTRLRRMVAIKTIVSGLGNDIDPVKLFEREAHTIAQMEHPHILPIYDFGEYDNSLYIVMRYVTGGSLEEVLRDGPMSPEDVLQMGDAIGAALDHAHSNNVIHLDLKPPNILLDSSQSPYLADFGLATVLDTQGRARNPGSGTLLYMAPEQIIAETIDHRADIYAFSIMLFHMLTGRLPFDGSNPLAMAQVQGNDDLPYVDDYISSLPSSLTDVLRKGTHQDPKYRHDTHAEIMEQMREIINPSAITVERTVRDDKPYDLQTDMDIATITDASLLEAIDIYSRARYDWQGGQGRFLLGVTHFILMSEYYQDASQHGLTIDQAGYQVLLRGAIEYNHELAYWWRKLDDKNRRWVCLHALRSGNTPARIRSLYRLETLPDEEGTSAIPRLVAQALEVETDDSAKIAALKVLGTRARLMKKDNTVSIKTEFRGRVISSITRLGIEVSPSAEWQPTIYSTDVDMLVAEQAFDSSEPVAEFAARTVGKMRSLAAVEHLSTQHENGRTGALQALAFARDEAPSLPDIVDREARFYAWITNTVRRLTENPVGTMIRFGIVFLAGWIAMGNHIWGFFRFVIGTLGNQRWANSLGMGITFGFFMAVTYLVTVETSNRLRGFWSWWMRLLLSGLLGYGMATLSFASFRYLFMQEPPNSILWDEMRFVGAAFAFGLVATSLLRLRGWQGVILTTVATFTPIFAIFNAYYFPQESTILPLAPFGLALGVFCGWRAAQLSEFEADFAPLRARFLPQIIGAVLSLIWIGLAWYQFIAVFDNFTPEDPVTWSSALNITTVSVVFGLLVGYWVNNRGRITFLLSALAGFGTVYAMIGWQFLDYSFTVPFITPEFSVMYYEGTALIPQTLQPIFNYDFDSLNQLYRLTLPTIIVVVIGVNFSELLAGWNSWIGAPRKPKERGAWMSATLIYIMILTAIISVLTLFSPGINRLWELAWSGWAFMTFVFALATFRWAKWGAQSLLWSGIFVLAGSIVFDAVSMYLQFLDGTNPVFFSAMPQINAQLQQWGMSVSINQSHFWMAWAMVLAVFVWGAQRRLLWGAIGIVTLLVAWYVVFVGTGLYASVAVFALTNVALVAYVLQPKYELMETERLRMPSFGKTPEPIHDALETVLHPETMPQPATPTRILVGDELPIDQRNTQLVIDKFAEMDTVAINRELAETESLITTPAIEINTEDLMTQSLEGIEINTEDLMTQSLEGIEINQDDLVFDDNPIDMNTILEREIDDTVDNQSDSTEQATKPQSSKIKIVLNTDALKKREAKTQSDENPTEISPKPKPIFQFDSSVLVNKNTVQLDKNSDDDAESDEDENDSEEE